MAAPSQWIEIFHSKPSMKNCYFLEKLPSGEFAIPSPACRLREAYHIRDGFRVFRLPARRVEFVLTNGTNRNWEDNNGNNYIIESPGRYVIEHGIRRVGDADNEECIQMITRPNDKYVQLEFRADLWEECYCSYQSDKKDWTPSPGVKMSKMSNSAEGKWFSIEIPCQKLAFAFNNGDGIWDSNLGKNYLLGCPGRYLITNGAVQYQSPSSRDLETAEPSKPLLPKATQPSVAGKIVDVSN